MWFWLLGRGIVHEQDDLRPDNPPSNPALLAYLEKDFIEHKYDLKHVLRLVLNSRTYQLSSIPTEANKDDTVHFSHYYARRLGAEVLVDAIGQVIGKSPQFGSDIPEPLTVLPEGFPAVGLYDAAIASPFLETFGRPPRDTGYASEGDLSFTSVQAMFLLNAPELHAILVKSPRVNRWLEEKKSDEEIVDELYTLALCRPPRPEEKKSFLESLDKQRRLTSTKDPKARAKLRALEKKEGPLNPVKNSLQDAVWTLLNSKQFLLNH